MSRHQPIAIVTPWWSEEGAGGAEFLARQIAGQLAGRGCQVEVLATCGRGAFWDWSEDYYPPGAVQENGLTVRRFPLDQRDSGRFARLNQAIADGRRLTGGEEHEFFANSVGSRALCAFIEANRDRFGFCFIPYLYGTTYFGVRAAPGRSLLIPCLHNEPIAYLTAVGAMMASARGLWFLSEAEYYFARALYPLHGVAADVVGAGMDWCGKGDGARFRKQHGLDGPYILFAGRRVPGKGFGLLLDLFPRFRQRHPQWTLVLAGPSAPNEPRQVRDGVLDVGYLEKQQLWDAMAGATAFCQPSRYESFSYVLMEAWVQETPAVVNADCDVLRWQCEASGGGLWFRNQWEFEAALLYLYEHPDCAKEIGQQGAEYVHRHLRWPPVIERAERLLAQCGFL